MQTIDINNLKVGDVFYSAQETNNVFFRKKIHRIIDGEDWFKYDKPLRTYELVQYKILGILHKKLEGKWDKNDEYNLETEYYIQSSTSKKITNYTSTISNADDENKYFVDKDAALEYIKILEEEAKELDKSL